MSDFPRECAESPTGCLGCTFESALCQKAVRRAVRRNGVCGVTPTEEPLAARRALHPLGATQRISRAKSDRLLARLICWCSLRRKSAITQQRVDGRIATSEGAIGLRGIDFVAHGE